ncbi:Putative peptidoglycan binding domain-containing protein [Desulfocicer vacuolatum DSM 3385]|uniref:Putative peptidoglycan binding domain-containing protein n=1 Tax=Desulfocicer vacuolatum DSM 3385 TaxID=1121400 RepID=A0A1W2CRM0_9BACT|nr:peptidoglycan-binding domain-containing protein [Desulfocicer vacuolatum]SMC87532.1 Putative peptidoglycan binding domain-containing protein [Desulfocicer vacuolatum DSM 3385]
MKKFIRMVCFLAGVLIVFALGGCASQMTSTPDQVKSLQTQLAEKDKTISSLNTELETAEKKLSMTEKSAEQIQFELEEQQRKADEARLMSTAPLLPPNPKVGECYARVFVNPTYQKTKETVLKKQASEYVKIIPAEYGYKEKEVLVKESSERLQVIPAQYGWETEKVLVKEASYKMVNVPAQYTWEEETILLKPAHTIWKKGEGLVEKVDNNTGEIMCLVEVPATYKTVKKKTLKTAATSKRIEIPAQYKTVKRKVLISPATVKKIVIPAEYKTVKVKEMITPPREERITIPAEYTTIERTEKLTDGKLEWRRVLCETNMGEDIITRLQTALRNNGHDPVFIDGVMGWRTTKALKAYQKEKGLAVGNITYETLESLKIVRNM